MKRIILEDDSSTHLYLLTKVTNKLVEDVSLRFRLGRMH